MFDVGSLTGPLGGIIAIAYGAGAASGYAFCLRTMYKLIKAQAEKDERIGDELLDDAKIEIARLVQRCDDKQRTIDHLQERLISGMHRQNEQITQSGLYLIDRDKVSKLKTEEGDE